ncbi:hypothetical protein KR51_00004850 [Rubidibacter lacunae KORDI 51-2]|uniref:Uncharacterized protein n=1 Tax=Rubidibacter lacunae KORDI 51-2 TaxID=582515 RepID=U5DM65_9CHRO|nr:SUMF1/EgtB/PvdO family nonheme iron enzyme [Rubidibacter lacunae]ERN42771.1 hypothetical protein KR51_00004850 [Rubidibacter lacunae KORDI 51-2]
MVDWALVIGINEYDYLGNLRYAQRDAERVQKYFLEKAKRESPNCDSSSRVFYFADDAPKIKSQRGVIIPAAPTKNNILSFLHEFFKSPILDEEGDNFWFFFSGHGMYSHNQGTDYLIPKDGNPNLLEDTAIDLNHVLRKIRNSGADNVILLTDCCLSENKLKKRGHGMNKQQGVITISACDVDAESYEIKQLEQGIFTYALMEALEGRADENCATVGGLCSYVRKRVLELSREFSLPQQKPFTDYEPNYKSHFILLPQYKTDYDFSLLLLDATNAELEERLEDAKKHFKRAMKFDPSNSLAIQGYDRTLKKIWERDRADNQPIPPQRNEPQPDRPGASQTPSVDQPESSGNSFDRTLESLRQLRDRLTGRLKSRGLELNQELFQETLREVLETPTLADFETNLDTEGQEHWAEAIRQYQVKHLQGKSSVDGIVAPSGPTFQVLYEDAIVTATVLLSSQAGIKPKLPPELQSLTVEVPTVNRKGRVVQTTKHRVHYRVEILAGGGPVMLMMAIPAGTFLMGSPEDEHEREDDEGPQHEVTVPPFFLGRYPVTQAQWRFVATKLTKAKIELQPNQSESSGAGRPVEGVSWFEAVEFCERLAAHTGRPYRLPSEAEWEYACRAGTKTPFHFGDTITTELANYNGYHSYDREPTGEWRDETTPVGQFLFANKFGLYDMHGNVWDWCQDQWHGSYEEGVVPCDGSAWEDRDEDRDEDARRIIRGGGWNDSPGMCRSAFRRFYPRFSFRTINIGFRVACAAPRT